MIMTTIEADRILIGAEFVPRFLDLPKVLNVAAGQTVELPADSTWDTINIEPGGTLTVSNSHDTIVRFIHLFNLGTIACGSEDAPITKKVEFVIRDVPINTAKDPFQWGNGLLNFGTREICGSLKTAWAFLATELTAPGATSITVDRDVTGWAVGDELLICDSRKPPVGTDQVPQNPRREATVTITAITGRVVTLSKPLDFEHKARRRWTDNSICSMPEVANLTRNIKIRSENPAGTRGHLVDVGHDAMWCDCANERSAMGRTKAVNLDSTSVDLSHIGTNQVGRYIDHHHHAMGFGSKSLCNVFRGQKGGGKWGMAVHGTHDAVIEDNICIDFDGAGFVTEDGYEVRNAFRRNFAAYILGNGDGSLAPTNNVGNVAIGSPINGTNPGAEGSGMWPRGIHNIFEGNINVCCTHGMMIMKKAAALQSIPSVPGGEPDTPFTKTELDASIPILWKDNVCNSNVWTGVEYWHIADFPTEKHQMHYNGSAEERAFISGPAQVHLVNCSLVGFNGLEKGADSGIAYVDSVIIEGGEIIGHAVGLAGGGNRLTKIAGGTKLSNVVDISHPAVALTTDFDMAGLVNVPGHVHDIEFGIDTVWPGPPAPFPTAGGVAGGGVSLALSARNEAEKNTHILRNYKGKNYLLFVQQGLGSNFAWPSDRFNNIGTPEQGLTMLQSWAKYGIAFGGEPLDPAQVAPLPLISPGLAREGLSSPPLGPPKAVITFPTTFAPMVDLFGDGTRWVIGLLTGDLTGVSSIIRAQIDGGPMLDIPLRDPTGKDQPPRYFSFGFAPGTPPTTNGTHTIKTWATDAAFNSIPASAMTFTYAVGAVVPPPDPGTCPTIDLLPAALPAGTKGSPYGATLSASAGVAPFTFTVTGGSLPPGLSLSPAGVITGTPLTAGAAAFTVKAFDKNSCPGTRVYTLTIADVQQPPTCPVIQVLPATLADGKVGQAYQAVLTADAGLSPFVFSVSQGTLPAGLSLTPTGLLSGTPTTSGVRSFTVNVVDKNNCPGSRTYSLTIAEVQQPPADWKPITAAFEQFGTERRFRLKVGSVTFELDEKD